MSAWKRTALEKLPEYRTLIEAADNPMELWIELHLKFEDAYGPSGLANDDLVARFFEFARWCMKTPNEGRYLSDVATATACAFYEHLPKNAPNNCQNSSTQRSLTSIFHSNFRAFFN